MFFLFSEFKDVSSEETSKFTLNFTAEKIAVPVLLVNFSTAQDKSSHSYTQEKLAYSAKGIIIKKSFDNLPSPKGY